MFEDPDEPAESQNDGGRPMSLLGAVMWMIGAHLIAMWVTLIAIWLFGRERDLMVGVVCQAVGYLLALYAMLRLHAPTSRIRDFVGLRSTPLVFPLVGLIMGVAAQYPGSWLQEQIFELFPRDHDGLGPLDFFFDLSFSRRVAVAVAAIVLGPIAEEIIFRGAAFTSVIDRHRPAVVIGVTAVAFTLIHSEVRHLPILLAMGLVLGHLRWASNSLLPPIVLHMAFNAADVVPLLLTDTMPVARETPAFHALAGFAVVGVGVALAHFAAKRRRS